MMPLGAAARAAGTEGIPARCSQAVGLGTAGARPLTLATVTTNCVNIYMSSLAWKSLTPRASGRPRHLDDRASSAPRSGALPGVWLGERSTNFMVVLGALLVPIGGLLIAHYYITDRRIDDALVGALYEEAGPFKGTSAAGMTAWAASAVVYFAANRWTGVGGTIPALATSVIVYTAVRRRRSSLDDAMA